METVCVFIDHKGNKEFAKVKNELVVPFIEKKLEGVGVEVNINGTDELCFMIDRGLVHEVSKFISELNKEQRLDLALAKVGGHKCPVCGNWAKETQVMKTRIYSCLRCPHVSLEFYDDTDYRNLGVYLNIGEGVGSLFYAVKQEVVDLALYILEDSNEREDFLTWLLEWGRNYFTDEDAETLREGEQDSVDQTLETIILTHPEIDHVYAKAYRVHRALLGS